MVPNKKTVSLLIMEELDFLIISIKNVSVMEVVSQLVEYILTILKLFKNSIKTQTKIIQ